MHFQEVSLTCWLLVGWEWELVLAHMDFLIGLLEYPHNMAADLPGVSDPQSEVEATMSFFFF